MLGSQLGRYRIEEELDAGGMGVVYRAYDTRLQRNVALKILRQGPVNDDTVRKRFRREALALSRLNHPNIATVHDFDSESNVDFLVMELIPGTSLTSGRNGRTPEPEVLRLGLQLAQGLAAAHSAGVLHRDLKPANVRVTPDGRLKILDFGLALLQQPTGTTADTATAPANAIVGTLPYMAPEQVQGGTIDERTDIYGAGAVLYELATGIRPFPEQNSARLIHAILHEPVRSPSSLNAAVSPGLEQAVLKALDKDPERRYQSARELAVDLGRLMGSTESATARALPVAQRQRRTRMAVAAALTVAVVMAFAFSSEKVRGLFSDVRVDSIAVLPMRNATGDATQDYLADGLMRGLVAKLARISTLRVTSPFSTLLLKKENKPLATIGSELGVSKVIEGSVSGRGDSVQIALALLDVATGQRLWSRTYTRARADLRSAQSDMARDIAEAVGVRVSSHDEELLRDEKPVQPAAVEAYFKGMYAGFEGKRAEAKSYFEAATKLDPTYAPAYAALAGNLIQSGWFEQTLPPMQAYPRAKELALKAMALDETMSAPHVQLAAIKLHHEWDWDGAEAEFKRAIELAPSDAGAHHIYAHHLLALGRLDESVRESRIAAELDPLNPTFATCVGWHCLYARQYEAAVEQCMKVIRDKRAVNLTYYYLGRVYARQGRLDEAIAALQTAVEKSGGLTPMVATLGYALARAGKRDDALQVLEKLEERAQTRYVSAMDVAVVHAGLNDADRVFEWLDKAFLERSTWLVHLAWDDRFTEFHSDPRFPALLRRIGLPEAARRPSATPQAVSLR